VFNYISEGSVSHINGVRPGFLGLQLVGHSIEQDMKHVRLCTCTKNPYKICHAFIPLAFFLAR